jgi:cytochrome c
LSVGHVAAAWRGSPFLGIAQTPTATVWTGVYTDAQAKRGQEIYQRACSYCHLPNLRGYGGDSSAAALVGAQFFLRWRSSSVGEMFATVQDSMPRPIDGNEPPTLTGQDYIDIISFVLKSNGMPPGATELPPDPSTLDRIVITDKP